MVRQKFPELDPVMLEEARDVYETARALASKACFHLDGPQTASVLPLVVDAILSFAASELVDLAACPDTKLRDEAGRKLIAIRIAAE